MLVYFIKSITPCCKKLKKTGESGITLNKISDSPILLSARCNELDAFCIVDPYTPEEPEPEEVDGDHNEETTDDVNKDEEQTEEGNCQNVA